LLVNNFVGPETHLWSVAVEMQFYLISPCLVMFLYKANPKLTWTLPVLIFAISTTLCVILTQKACPDLYDAPKAILVAPLCYVDYFNTVYLTTYCRMSPYGFGMYVAHLHFSYNKSENLGTSTDDQKCVNSWLAHLLDWVSFGFAGYLCFTGNLDAAGR